MISEIQTITHLSMSHFATEMEIHMVDLVFDCQKFRHEVITDAIKGPDGGSGGHPVDDYDQKTEERRGHCCSESSEMLTIGDFDSIHLCI